MCVCVCVGGGDLQVYTVVGVRCTHTHAHRYCTVLIFISGDSLTRSDLSLQESRAAVAANPHMRQVVPQTQRDGMEMSSRRCGGAELLDVDALRLVSYVRHRYIKLSCPV